MLDPQPARDTPAGFAPSAQIGPDTSILRRRVATLTRTIDEREATIATLMQQLQRARGGPSRSPATARLCTDSSNDMQTPIRRVIEKVRLLRRNFDWVQSAAQGFDAEELRRIRLSMSGAIDEALDELDRIEAAIAAAERFSPPADAA